MERDALSEKDAPSERETPVQVRKVSVIKVSVFQLCLQIKKITIKVFSGYW